jgi:general secretion pathway protein G
MRIRSTRNRAFTLIEILIVVVILGILAAIVIPQFSDASTEASESSVRSQLQTVRSQLELWKVKHNDLYPTDAEGIQILVDNDYLQKDPTAAGYDIGGYTFVYDTTHDPMFYALMPDGITEFAE